MGIQIQSNDRIAVIGDTGDGKTTLGLKIMAIMDKQARQHTVVLNPAAEDKYYDLFGEGSPVLDPKWPKVQHVTPMLAAEKTSYAKSHAGLWQQIFTKGNVKVFLDETSAMSETKDYPNTMMYNWQMGRRRNIGIVWITQRPTKIPTFTLDLSQHFFIGDVRGRNLSFLEGYFEQPLGALVQARPQYSFIYWSKREKSEPRIVRL